MVALPDFDWFWPRWAAEILLLACAFYYIFRFLRGTRSAQVLTGRDLKKAAIRRATGKVMGRALRRPSYNQSVRQFGKHFASMQATEIPTEIAQDLTQLLVIEADAVKARVDMRDVASAQGNWLGRTSRSSARPMVHMARAAAPILPGCEGATNTTQIRESTSSSMVRRVIRHRKRRQTRQRLRYGMAWVTHLK